MFLYSPLLDTTENIDRLNIISTSIEIGKLKHLIMMNTKMICNMANFLDKNHGFKNTEDYAPESSKEIDAQIQAIVAYNTYQDLLLNAYMIKTSFNHIASSSYDNSLSYVMSAIMGAVDEDVKKINEKMEILKALDDKITSKFTELFTHSSGLSSSAESITKFCKDINGNLEEYRKLTEELEAVVMIYKEKKEKESEQIKKSNVDFTYSKPSAASKVGDNNGKN